MGAEGGMTRPAPPRTTTTAAGLAASRMDGRFRRKPASVPGKEAIEATETTEATAASVTLGERTLPYQWKASPRRRTASISIHPDRGVVVHTPRRYSRERVEAFLQEKAAWVLKHFARLEEESRKRPRFAWEQGEGLPFQGGSYPLRFLLDGGRDQVRLEDGQFWVSLPLDHPASGVASAAAEAPAFGVASAVAQPPAFRERVRERMMRWYRQQAAETIIPRVAHYKALLGVKPARIRIKQQKRRWGSCSAKGALNFNWQLILAPAGILDYVVVHELCHLIELNHSPRFWSQVGRVMPDYRERKNWLRRNGCILDL